jgi:hypothetical protein
VRKGEEDRSGEGEETNEGRTGIGTRRKGEDDRSGRGDERKGEDGDDKIGSMSIQTMETRSGEQKGTKQ